MQNNRLLIFALSCLIIGGCLRRAFPDEKFIFSETYRSLINPYKAGDTLVFENKEGQTEKFAITSLDSTTHNSKGGCMTPRPSKDVVVWCREIPSGTENFFAYINIHPDNGEQSFGLSFKNFNGRIDKYNDSLISSPILANNQVMGQYYRVENNISVQNPANIKSVYISKEKGMVAYQDGEGNWWTRK